MESNGLIQDTGEWQYLASQLKQTSGLHSLLKATQGHPEVSVQAF